MLPAKTIRRWLPLVLLIVVAGAAWRAADVADIDDASLEPVAYEQQLTSPMFNARRVPETLQWPVSRDNLAPALTAILADSTPNTCLSVSVDDRELGAQNLAQPLVPASNQKLLSTYAALQLLGADRVFTTTVSADATVSGGVIDGNVYLVGGGDPFLGTEDWWSQYEEQEGRAHTRLETLADRVAATGVTEITGSILGDESRFDQVRTGVWAQRLIDSNQSGPLSALAVNEGYTRWPATYDGTSRPRVPATDPAANAAAVFARLLEERGISVGSTGAGPAPVGAQALASIDSPPMREIITHVNSYSNNFGAEILVKHLGLNDSGIGSTVAGATAISDFLADQGFPMNGVSVVDGSGLAETNTLTCGLLAALLESAGPESVFASTLSIGGERGSLIRRHLESPAQGQVLAKTGTLNGVTALSGYTISVVDGSAIVFAYIANGELAGQDESLKALQEPFVEELVQYPEAPSLDQLQPLAAVPVN